MSIEKQGGRAHSLLRTSSSSSTWCAAPLFFFFFINSNPMQCYITTTPSIYWCSLRQHLATPSIHLALVARALFFCFAFKTKTFQLKDKRGLTPLWFNVVIPLPPLWFFCFSSSTLDNRIKSTVNISILHATRTQHLPNLKRTKQVWTCFIRG